ncbi:MAG: GTPase Era [Tissierellia bacterium]|nr:GTPase Era [Tissierellia bacterium]
MNFKSGFVTVIGRPNVGKSTLLNRIIGEKISIISDKPQTTRNRIQMVYTDEAAQIIFLDTPGIQMPKNVLGEYMLKVSRSTLEDVDIILFMVDSGKPFGKLDTFILRELEGITTPVLLVLNKIDEIDIALLAERIEVYQSLNRFVGIVPISAIEDTNIDQLLEQIKAQLPEGPMYYDEDTITDQPERAIVGEIIREKILNNMDEEIPHGVSVEVESMKQRPDRELIDIHAVIHVEKKSHKGMVIGKGGHMIQTIGTQARHDIERLLDIRVNLKLWVKISKDWRDSLERIREFGYK